MNLKPLNWILKRISKRIPAMVMITLAHIASALLGVGMALGSRRVIDGAVSGDMKAVVHACILQGMLILGLLAFQAAARFGKEQLRGKLDRDWKKDLFRALLRGEYSEVSRFHSAELMNRLNQDVRIVNDGLLNVLPGAVTMVVRLAAVVTALGMLEWKLMAGIALLAAVIFPATALLRGRLKELHKAVNGQDGVVTGLMQEALEKLLIVQGMDLAQQVEQRADRAMGERYSIFQKRKNLSFAAHTAVSILYYGAGFLALICSAYGLLEGRITFGTLTAIITLVGQLQAPLVNLSGVIPQYIAMVASGERLMELDQIRKMEDIEPLLPKNVMPWMDAICAEELTFSYDRDLILDKAGFTFPKGSFTVIAGQSGIGKSTLLKLMLGIFHPEQGALYLQCGEEKLPLNRMTRKLFAYVPQGNLLLSGTVRENLTIACPEATEEQIRRATFVSCMDEFLAQLPMGLETVLGESGAGLSEGQTQRLAIARAVLSDAPILLLDECTSALDEQTELNVLARIKALPGKTCIVVTHRNAASEFCDEVIRIEDGKIIAGGEA